jgi:hypothetical protein
VVQRGVIADLVDGRSREGRIMRHMEAELIKHVGGAPSFPQRLLIERIVKIRMQLDIFEEKLARARPGRRMMGAPMALCTTPSGSPPARSG